MVFIYSMQLSNKIWNLLISLAKVYTYFYLVSLSVYFLLLQHMIHSLQCGACWMRTNQTCGLITCGLWPTILIWTCAFLHFSGSDINGMLRRVWGCLVAWNMTQYEGMTQDETPARLNRDWSIPSMHHCVGAGTGQSICMPFWVVKLTRICKLYDLFISQHVMCV